LQELCFGVLRTLSQLEWMIQQLMERPMTGKQRTVHYLIMVGFYQLLHTRIPAHAALAETVEGAVVIKRPQLKGLINGVLRQFQRRQDELLAEFAQSDLRFLHPSWLVKRIKSAYPQQWEAILEANNQRPPMWLRVNRNHHTRDAWIDLLTAAGLTGFPHPDYPDAVRLETPVQFTPSLVLTKVGSPFRMLLLRGALNTCCRKMASRFSTYAARRAVKRRTFWKLLRKLTSWPSMWMKNAYRAFTTI
jgi:16S rRNA (cytosine(967)-C(5))-methyltransferase